MKKTRLLLLLALLMTAATGAWADETLLTTITATAKEQASYSTANVATVSFSYTANGSSAYLANWGWWGYGWTATVTAAEGYTITKCIFYDDADRTATDSEAPFVVETTEEDKTPRINGTPIDGGNMWSKGIKKIEVYGYVTPAAAGYTVSLKDGVKDADKWTVKVGEGQAQALPIGGLKGDGSETVMLKYTGRLKVKGVKATSDAVPAKEPATVTTAPTGAAIVGRLNTNSTALVSGGVADGGTLWYAVTTTNTKPTSTDGFSKAVPTAQTITASGKVYVWYYVKGDGTHTDSEIAATAIEVPVADIVWDATNATDIVVEGNDLWYVKEGVTLSCNAEDIHAGWNDSEDPKTEGISFQVLETGGYNFTAPDGKAFTKIEMTLNGSEGWDIADLGTGWTFDGDFLNEIFTVTWTGSATSTDELLPDTDDFAGATVKSIAFYLVDAE